MKVDYVVKIPYLLQVQLAIIRPLGIGGYGDIPSCKRRLLGVTFHVARTLQVQIATQNPNLPTHLPSRGRVIDTHLALYFHGGVPTNVYKRRERQSVGLTVHA